MNRSERYRAPAASRWARGANRHAMSFKEIARELGISQARVWQLYCSAMKKVAAHAQVIERMNQLSALRQQLRAPIYDAALREDRA